MAVTEREWEEIESEKPKPREPKSEEAKSGEPESGETKPGEPESGEPESEESKSRGSGLLRKGLMILMAVGFLAGLALLFYPLVSNLWNNYRNAKLFAVYQETMAEAAAEDPEGVEEAWAAAHEYNENLTFGIRTDAFADTDTAGESDEETSDAKASDAAAENEDSVDTDAETGESVDANAETSGATNDGAEDNNASDASDEESADANAQTDGSTDAEQEEDYAAYLSLLDTDGSGRMGFISIPKIDVTLPIYHTTSESVLKKGVGHLYGTSLPVGGEGTHAVLSAHRGLPSASLFTDLDQLEEGDQFYLYILDDVLAYEVDQILIVEPSETSSLTAEADEDLVTLVTCTPYGVNTHRLLVRGHRVPYDPDEEAAQADGYTGSWYTNYVLWVVLGLLAAGAVILMIWLVRRRVQRKEETKHHSNIAAQK